MDRKTQLLDENATLEQRRKKDKVALDKVSRLKPTIHYITQLTFLYYDQIKLFYFIFFS